MLIAGGVLLAVAVAAFFWHRSTGKRLAALASTETLPCTKLTVDQACEVVGTAQPGPAAVLKGPASGRECVWWRHEVTEHWEEWTTDSNGKQTRNNRSRQVKDEASSDLFTLKDEAGQVLVSVAGATIDDPVKSFRERKDVQQSISEGLIDALLTNDRDREIEVEEWILPVGEQLYVRGQPTDSEQGLMMVDPGDQFLISTRSEEELTSSAGLWNKVSLITMIVSAVAGVGLLIAGALA